MPRLLSLAFALCVAANAASVVASDRPNILFVLTDDQSPLDFGFYNPDSRLETPTLDRLAERGMVIENAHHMGSFSGAVCTPSRHMIMSGRTVWRLPIGPGTRRDCPEDILSNTLAPIFNRAGYSTMRTCKRGNSYGDANKQFTVVHDATKRGGTDASGSAWHADRVLDFLADRGASGDAQPFFIYFGLSHPHDTRDGKPDLLAKYGATNHADPDSLPAPSPEQPPLPTNYLPGHPFENTHSNVRDEVAAKGVWAKRDETTIRNELGREFACSENIDRQLERVLSKLEAMGELDNTYIFYTSDHGIAIGRHGLQGKQNLYEHTWRVPMVVAGPGIEPGSRAPGNVYLLDLLATFCDLADVETPDSNEGVSFKPVLMGDVLVTREVLYGVYSGGRKPGIRAVRQGDWKLIKYESPELGVQKTQLFNLAENPDELLAEHHDPAVHELTGVTPQPHQVNLADDARHAKRLAEMEGLLLEQMQRHGDPYRFSNQPQDEAAIKPADYKRRGKRQRPKKRDKPAQAA